MGNTCGSTTGCAELPDVIGGVFAQSSATADPEPPIPLTSYKTTFKIQSGNTGLLGTGSFGKVYRASHRKTHSSVAIKVLERKSIKASSIYREWSVLEEIGAHPSIVEYRGTFKSRSEIAFAFEVLEGGELFERLITRGPLGECIARVGFYDVASALEFLHRKGIVHRDLKPENILLVDNTDDSRMKLADFGLSQIVEEPHERLLKICGTWAYSAPEMSDPSRPG